MGSATEILFKAAAGPLFQAIAGQINHGVERHGVEERLNLLLCLNAQAIIRLPATVAAVFRTIEWLVGSGHWCRAFFASRHQIRHQDTVKDGLGWSSHEDGASTIWPTDQERTAREHDLGRVMTETKQVG